MRISDWSSDVCSSDLSTTSASSCSWEPNESTPGAGNGSTRALAAGDPDDALAAAWTGKEKVRNVYLTDDLTEATDALEDAIARCSDPDSGPELARLLKTLRRWRSEIQNHHRTGASNGPVEAANLLIKQVKRSGRGFRNVKNYRLRILLAGGANPLRETQTRHEHPTPPSQVGRVGPNYAGWGPGFL